MMNIKQDPLASKPNEIILVTLEGPPQRRCLLPTDVRILDTKMVARLVHKALAMHAIDMNEFAVVVLGQNYAYTKNLLCHPQPYPRLPENVQADYWTMAKWLQKTLPERLEPFNLILRAKGLPEKPIDVDMSSDSHIKNSSLKSHLHMTPAKLISQFTEQLQKFQISMEEFINVIWRSSSVEDAREFYQFVNKPPLYYDSLKDSEVDKFLCIQTWLCKPDNQKVDDFNKEILQRL